MGFEFDQEKDPSFEPGFNTPKHRVKGTISNDRLFKNFGFNVSGRWNSEYLYQASFADGTIEAATVLDAQISYGFPKLKSTLKIGFGFAPVITKTNHKLPPIFNSPKS